MSKIGTDFGTETLTNDTNPQSSKSTQRLLFLRFQRNNKDRRISLKTKSLAEAQLAAAVAHATLSAMKIDATKIKDWTIQANVETGDITVTTDGTEADNQSAERAAEAVVRAYKIGHSSNYTLDISSTPKKTVSIGQAYQEYLPFLAKSDTALKTQRMAESTINGLIKILCTDFDMAQLNDDIIETRWLEPRLQEVAKTTAKRDLTFVRGFVIWAADKKRKYTPAPLSLKVEAKGENWAYLSATDLKLIFDNLHLKAETVWQLYIPLIALYTGARIGEIANLRVDDFIEKNGISTIRLRGTKTDASDRTIPIHQHLIELGLTEYALIRHTRKKLKLFDIAHHDQNGPGATASKWYTKFKKSIGLTDPLKVFHSFRPTIVDHLKQAGSGFEARCQYLGHDQGGGVHNKIYGRNELNINALKVEVVDKIELLI